YGYFGTLAGLTHNFFNGDQTVINLWYLVLEQALQECRRCTGKNDFRITVHDLNTLYHSTHYITFAVTVFRDLLTFRDQQFVFFLVEQQHLAVPYLVYLTGNNLANKVLVFLEQEFFLHVL